MNVDLTGKTALVTGSTQGIGLAIAQGLASSGARVVVNGRNQKRIDDAAGKPTVMFSGWPPMWPVPTASMRCSRSSRPSIFW